MQTLSFIIKFTVKNNIPSNIVKQSEFCFDSF